MKLDDNAGFGPFGFYVTKEPRELDENVNKGKSRN